MSVCVKIKWSYIDFFKSIYLGIVGNTGLSVNSSEVKPDMKAFSTYNK